MELDFILVGSFLSYLPEAILSPASLFTAGTLTGFDASGHIAEETKNAR